MRRSLVFILVSLLSPLAWAQSTLSGTVRTSDGVPLPQVAIVLEKPGTLRRVTTGPAGHYRVDDLASGDYTIRVEAPGLILDGDARVNLGADARLDLTLKPAPVREQIVVTATRGDAPASALGVSVSVLDRAHIDEREASSFLDLLREVPGVTVARAGPLGSQSSAFLRGGESNFARVLIDGVPVNEAGGYYNFAAQFPLELARVEVVRGAASSLYGTDALAGVIHLVTQRAGLDEKPSASAEVEAGEFAWRRARGGTSGRAGRLDWNAGLVYLQTDNEHPNSAFEQKAGAIALGAQLGRRSSLRGVLRGETSTAGTPGAVAYGRPDRDALSDHGELQASAALRHAGERSVHELRAGIALTDQLSKNPLDSGSYLPRAGARSAAFLSSDFPNPLGYQNDTRRLTLGYQVETQLGGSHLATAGAELERETGEIGDRSAPPFLSPQRTNVGAYVQDRITLWSRLALTLGGRVERNDSFGTRAVPRAAAAWRFGPASRATTLRASAGAGIKEPSFFQSFGVSVFALGNPDLKPERSGSYDAGIEQRLLRDRLRVEATLFHHDYRDQIAYKVLSNAPFRASYENLGRTRARGLEIALDSAPSDRVRLGAQYTLLDGDVLVSTSTNPLYAVGRPLLRRPKQQGSLWASFRASRISGGATLVLVGRRADSDFLGIGLTENDGYARLDARIRVGLGHGLEAFAVAENLRDRQYQEILGYPALGRAFRLGLRFQTHEARP